MISLAGFAFAIAALTAVPPLPPETEQEARVIEAMLIAPCCYTQQVSVHQSPAADAVRQEIRTRLAADQTRQQILDAFVAQHGKRILAQPPATGFDLTLFVAPFVVLAGSIVLLGGLVRRMTRRIPSNPCGIDGDRSVTAQDAALEVRLDQALRDMD